MIEKLPIKIRPISQLDVNFILNSWLKSFRGAFFVKDIHPTTYYAEHHSVCSELLQTCQTYVACSDSDPTEIYGFICAEYISGTLVVHYIYVKHTFRNMGIAKALLAQFAVAPGTMSFYTHHNSVAHKQAAAYQMLYSPYLALLPKYRKGKSKNNLDLNTKIEETEKDGTEFKQHRARGGSKRRITTSEGGSPEDGSPAD